MSSPTPDPQDGQSLPQGRPDDVPVFRCLIYLRPQETGGIEARVANLPELACSVASERAALETLVTRFKQQVSEWVETETEIPWIDPPPPLQPGEQKRL